MAAPLRPAGKDRDGLRRGGAVAAAGTADPNRKRRVAALAVLAALIVLAAVLIIIKAGGSSHHTASAARHSAATASVTPGPVAAVTPTHTAGASSTSAGAGALPAFGLVGGGGVAARPATGKLAIKGSAGDILFGRGRHGPGCQRPAGRGRRRAGDPPAPAVRGHRDGYTDAIGIVAVNHRLSLQRPRRGPGTARAAGSTGIRFLAAARGQGSPVAANSTAAGRQLNRRAVISLG